VFSFFSLKNFSDQSIFDLSFLSVFCMNSYAMAVVRANRVQIDVSDPLFLHPSDQPGQGLLVDVFNGDDFEN